MKKEARQLIIEYAKNNEMTDREDLIALVEDDIVVPEYEELAKRYIANLIAQVVATVKDEYGRRWILARRSAEDTQYINLQKCNDIKTLESIKRKIARDIAGRQSSLKKVDVRINYVQLSFFPQIDEQMQQRKLSN